MTDRTDAERFAFCFVRSAKVHFYYEERGVEVSLGDGRAEFQNAGSEESSRDVWRKCVDELMDKEANHE